MKDINNTVTTSGELTIPHLVPLNKNPVPWDKKLDSEMDSRWIENSLKAISAQLFFTFVTWLFPVPVHGLLCNLELYYVESFYCGSFRRASNKTRCCRCHHCGERKVLQWTF